MDEKMDNGEKKFEEILEKIDLNSLFSQARKYFIERPKIAIAGQTNAGKSELIGALFGKSIAPVSQASDYTKEKHEYLHEEMGVLIYDLPGMGGEILNANAAFYNLAEVNPHVLLHIIPGFAGPINEDIEFRKIVEERGVDIPTITIISQVDTLNNKDREEVLNDVCERFGLKSEEVIMVSSRSGEGINDLVTSIFNSLSLPAGVGFATALRGFMEVKDKAAMEVILRYSAIAFAIGAIPIPVADMPILISLQVAMIREINSIYGISNSITMDIIEGGLAGIGFRTIARQLIKLLPGWGWAISGSVAASGTFLLGYATREFARKTVMGEKPDLKKLIDDIRPLAEKEYKEKSSNIEISLDPEIEKSIRDIRYLIDTGAITEAEGIERINKILEKRKE